MGTLTLGSLFDGSGGFPLGGILAGIKPVWQSEIEPFPIRVTTKRLPFVKHYGDVNTLDGGELEPVDIITFGSPCTDLSIAGKRAGLEGSQSGLFHQAIRIIKEMRENTNARYPRFIVWENVPGAFSSHGGDDFQKVLEEICGICDDSVSVPGSAKWEPAGCILGDGFSVAWRVLDADAWGVPQRRKRIYLVGHLTGHCAGKILFESEGVSGYSAEGFRAWQRTACRVEGGAGETGGGICLNDQGGNRMDVTHETTATLRAEAHHPPVVMSAGFCTEHSAKAGNIGYEAETAPTLRAGVVPAAVYENHSQDTRYTGPVETAPTVLSTYGTGGNNQPFVVEHDTFGICSKDSNSMKSDNPKSGFYDAETSRMLDANGGNPTCNQGGIAVVETVKTFDVRQSSDGTVNMRNHAYESNTSRCVDRGGNMPGSNHGGIAVVSVQGMGVDSSSKASFHTLFSKEKAETLVATDWKDPPTVVFDNRNDNCNQERAKLGMSIEQDDRFAVPEIEPGAVAYSSSRAGYWLDFQKEKSGSLIAGGYKGQNTVAVLENNAIGLRNSKENDLDGTLQKEKLQSCSADRQDYTVRRLTPTECARLQGFPDWWCSGLATENPTEEDIRFWQDVFETHRRALGKTTKPKTRNQIVKWLKNPHTDSAEYKMWGNGVALPCVFFVLAGIAYYADK